MNENENYNNPNIMKKLLFFALSGMMTLGMLNACKEHEASTQLTVTGGSTRQTVYADDAEGSADVSFETAGGWTSTITEGAATRAEEGETRAVATWITISPSSGSTAGDYTISITLDTNFTGADRTATITITSGGESITITVTQKAETEDGEKPVPEPTYNEFTVGGETFTMSEADSYMEYYGHGTNPTAEEMIVRLVSNDGHSACLSVTLPDGNQRLAPGTYTFYTGEVATAPAGRLLGERESFVYDNTADEMVGYFTAGTLTVSVSNTGDAIYTIAVDCTLDSGGKFAGTYRGGLAWYDESSVAVTGVTLNKDATTLTVGGTEMLTATIVPDTATNQNVTWKSSAEAIATVDATGKIMAIASGEATITVTSVADATKTATCTVTVTAKETDLLSEQYITDKAFLRLRQGANRVGYQRRRPSDPDRGGRGGNDRRAGQFRLSRRNHLAEGDRIFHGREDTLLRV
jgi:uncharacterized protein YjdB